MEISCDSCQTPGPFRAFWFFNKSVFKFKHLFSCGIVPAVVPVFVQQVAAEDQTEMLRLVPILQVRVVPVRQVFLMGLIWTELVGSGAVLVKHPVNPDCF